MNNPSTNAILAEASLDAEKQGISVERVLAQRVQRLELELSATQSTIERLGNEFEDLQWQSLTESEKDEAIRKAE